MVKERYKEGPDGREKGQNMSLHRGGKDQIDGIKDDVRSETNAEHFEKGDYSNKIAFPQKITNFQDILRKWKTVHNVRPGDKNDIDRPEY